MQKRNLKSILSLIVCMVLIAAMALCITACGNKNSGEPIDNSSITATQLGEGETTFNFSVIGTDGNETKFEIKTNKTTVGEALLELGLIAGEDSAYGLYVKTVNGTTLDYNTDGKYWAFYENGNYAVSGVDTTNIVNGATYTFKAE